MVNVVLDSSSFEQTVKANKIVFIDFFAEWCGPCKQSEPSVDKMANEYETKAFVVKVDVDKHQDLAQTYGVMSIPTVVILKDGIEVDRKVGFPGEQVYRNMLDAVINKG